ESLYSRLFYSIAFCSQERSQRIRVRRQRRSPLQRFCFSRGAAERRLGSVCHSVRISGEFSSERVHRPAACSTRMFRGMCSLLSLE
uniref:Uncharacterized protein n=1 Tax=Gasterosteus aculeatus TaxID=69293 RepID=G3NR18_GASAC